MAARRPTNTCRAKPTPVDTSIALSAFTLLFLAELGDKSQLMTMALAHRYRPLPVVAGVFTAFLLLNLLAVLLGSALGEWLPEQLLLVIGGLLFLVFAYRSWREGHGDAQLEQETGQRAAFLTSFTLIFATELGDKTQLATLALAAQTGAPWSVLVGGTLALWTVALLGVLVGTSLLRRVPAIWVHRAAALLFLVFGLSALGRALLLQLD